MSLFWKREAGNAPATWAEGGPGGGGVSEITSDDASVAITNPTGPTVDLSVSGGGSSTVLAASVALTSAQLKALNATPLQVIAAPGAGKIIIPDRPFLFYTAGGTPYTLGSENLALYPNDPDAFADFQDWANWFPAGLLDQATDGFLEATPYAGTTTVYPPDRFTNKALMIWNEGTELTDGDGTVQLILTYTIFDLT